jgi:hypothetical protein
MRGCARARRGYFQARVSDQLERVQKAKEEKLAGA